jgi:putative ABC transport system permease protein
MNELRRLELPAEVQAPRPPRLVNLLLPARLAWRQLRAERARLWTAIAGVMFACVLVFMQLGFRAALFDSATALPQAMHGELFLINPLTTAMFRPEQFPRVRAFQTLADPDVAQAVPIYLSFGTWRNPVTGVRRTIQLVGFDTATGAVAFPGLEAVIEDLKRPDTIAFDRKSRPEFGPVPQLLAERGPFEVQIADRRLELVGLIDIGPSFGADGNAVMTETNFRRIVTQRKASNTDLVALRLHPGVDIPTVAARLRQLLPADVAVLTYDELVAWERNYWETATPIGFIFMFGSLMGLVVGMVIVYQILFSDIASHIPEYATLKAMGYAHAYLRRAVMSAALLLAVLGFIPGILTSIGLYQVVAQATFLPLEMDPERGMMVFGMIFAMCAGAGLLAVRKLRDANPADMF